MKRFWNKVTVAEARETGEAGDGYTIQLDNRPLRTPAKAPCLLPTRALADAVASRNAEGVIFCAPSFCDPALLDRPMLAQALDKRGISHVSLKYAENTGQFQTIREQAGTFADSIKLWGAA